MNLIQAFNALYETADQKEKDQWNKTNEREKIIVAEDFGISKLDNIVTQFNRGNITINTMISRIWNAAYNCGKNNE
ncbi:MAG: hypothetical protein FK734_06325 [Asgard group archaeon]|nr:hypothetical protein [Asgard group archaeon]